jgi:histone H3/H4
MTFFRSLSSFYLPFLLQHVGEGVAVVAKAMGQLWGALSAKEKKVYQDKAAKERERVSKELEEWKAAGGIVEAEKKGGAADPLALDFPVARIRKICKLDPEVRGLSKEALMLVTKCAELSLQKLGAESVRVAQLQNRRKLLPDDVANVCAHREQFLFLKDDVKDLLRNMEQASTENYNSNNKKVDGARQAAAAGSKPLTSYFGSSIKK